MIILKNKIINYMMSIKIKILIININLHNIYYKIINNLLVKVMNLLKN